MKLTERVAERIANSLRAYVLRGCPETVHTDTGETGKVVEASVLSGKVELELNDGQRIIVPARKVADLNTPLSSKPTH